MSDVQTVMILPVAAAPSANKIAAVLNVDIGGEHTFEGCRLSATGLDPVTHFGASCLICEEVFDVLGDAGALHDMCATLAVQRERECPTLAECVEAVGAVQITANADPFTVFAAAGLQVVAEPV